jgi:hypothetical protein
MWTPPAIAQFAAPGGAIPVVANNPGLQGTFWRSDVSVLNINDVDTSIVLVLLPEIRNGQPVFETMGTDPISLPAGSQLTMTNIVQSVFGLIDKKGVLSVFTTTGAPVVMSSRVYTFGADGGSFGQDVHSILAANTAWASGLRHDSFYRTNVGVALPGSPAIGQTVVFTIEVYDDDGSLVGSGFLNFDQAGLQQRSFSAFGVGALVDGYLVVRCSDPSIGWYAYASTVDQISGDAVYRAVRSRQSDLP